MAQICSDPNYKEKDMDLVWIIIPLIFFAICLGYVGFLGREGKTWKT